MTMPHSTSNPAACWTTTFLACSLFLLARSAFALGDDAAPAERLFRVFDRDQNGTLDASEFQQLPALHRNALVREGWTGSQPMSRAAFVRAVAPLLHQLRAEAALLKTRGTGGSIPGVSGDRDVAQSKSFPVAGSDVVATISIVPSSSPIVGNVAVLSLRGTDPSGEPKQTTTLDVNNSGSRIERSSNRQERSAGGDRGKSSRRGGRSRGSSGDSRERFSSSSSPKITTSSSNAAGGGQSASASDANRGSVAPPAGSADSTASPPIPGLMAGREKLPANYREADEDGDGQIGWYEWRKWKQGGTFDSFVKFDRNRDGFLTPDELGNPPVTTTVAVANSSKSTSPTSTPNASANRPGGGNSDDDWDDDDNDNLGGGAMTSKPAQPAKSVTVASAPAAVSPASGKSEAKENTTAKTTSTATTQTAANPRAEKEAREYFELLDKNRDGQLYGAEWDGSRILKPKFEKAGISLTQPMSQQQFVEHYLKLQGN